VRLALAVVEHAVADCLCGTARKSPRVGETAVSCDGGGVVVAKGLGGAVVAVDGGGVVEADREGVAAVAGDGGGVVVGACPPGASAREGGAEVAGDGGGVVVAELREGEAVSPWTVAVLLSPPPAKAVLPSPMTSARFWFPPVAVALLPSPLAIATDPVPLASQNAVPACTRTSPLVATQMFAVAAAAVCTPSAAKATAATPIRIIHRLCMSSPSVGSPTLGVFAPTCMNGQAQRTRIRRPD